MNNEKRRQEATAIVMLGVIGSEFGKEIEPNKSTSKPDKLKRVSMEGFGIANHSLAWHTSTFATSSLFLTGYDSSPVQFSLSSYCLPSAFSCPFFLFIKCVLCRTKCLFKKILIVREVFIQYAWYKIQIDCRFIYFALRKE